MNSYLVSFLSGLFIYVMMYIDCKCIESTNKPINPKIPLLVSLMVWFICEFVICQKNSSMSFQSVQPILTGGFYN